MDLASRPFEKARLMRSAAAENCSQLARSTPLAVQTWPAPSTLPDDSGVCHLRKDSRRIASSAVAGFEAAGDASASLDLSACGHMHVSAMRPAPSLKTYNVNPTHMCEYIHSDPRKPFADSDASSGSRRRGTVATGGRAAEVGVKQGKHRRQAEPADFGCACTLLAHA